MNIQLMLVQAQAGHALTTEAQTRHEGLSLKTMVWHH